MAVSKIIFLAKGDSEKSSRAVFGGGGGLAIAGPLAFRSPQCGCDCGYGAANRKWVSNINGAGRTDHPPTAWSSIW